MQDFDVVVVGGGGAGVAAAVAARQAGARVALLTKEPAGYGDTRIAVGLITYPGLRAGDTPDVFYRDVMTSGEHLSDPALVQTVVQDAEAGALSLESFGYLYRRDEEGRISGRVTSRAGGHTVGRTVAGWGGGLQIGTALRAACARAGVTVLEDTMAVQLLQSGAPAPAGPVTGVMACNLVSGELFSLGARAVILATGGAGWLYYPHTDCVRSATGDGFALALQAGAELLEMEQVQFVPFGLTHPESMMGIFVGEPSTAGPYGRLLNGQGEVILEGVHNMTRAQVARAMAMEVTAGRVGPHGGLFLDLRPNLEHEKGRAARESQESSGMFGAVGPAYGPKAYAWEEPWEVLPTAHYHMGGVRVDSDGRTRVPGLYAAGAVGGGLHGGNRLGSLALAELFIFGRRAGAAAAGESLAAGRIPGQAPAGKPPATAEALEQLPGRRGRHRPIELIRRLQRVMWEGVGPVREASGLTAALDELDRLDADAADLRIAPGRHCNSELRDALELQHMLLAARAMAGAAQARRESRGAHVRLDFPATGPDPFHTVTQLDAAGRLIVRQEVVTA